MSRPPNSETVNGVFNLNSLLEDLPQVNSASAPSTPFPDAMSKAGLGRGLHAHHASLSATPFAAFHNAGQPSSPSNLGGARTASVFDYQTAEPPRSAYRMPRVINTAVFNGQIRRGRCKFFNSQKGFGFINDGKPEDLDNVEVFVHFTAISSSGGFRSLGEGEECEYTLVPGPKGYQASNVTGPGGRPVVGDPKARAPIAKHAPPYMFVPPHGAHFYDPYHAHPSSYYPHSPYGQVMLSIVPTNPAAPYPMAAHPAYAQPAVPGASPYGAIPAASAASMPHPSAASPVNGASSHQYLYSGGMAPSAVPTVPRTSPFAPANVSNGYSGLGLGPLSSPAGGAAGKTPWQAPSGLGAIGGQRVSSNSDVIGRFGSPGVPTTTVTESSASTLANDIFSNGAPPTSVSPHSKRQSGTIAPNGTTPTSPYENGVHGRRNSSTAQDLFDGAGGSSPVKSPATGHRTAGNGLSSASSLLYNASK